MLMVGESSGAVNELGAGGCGQETPAGGSRRARSHLL